MSQQSSRTSHSRDAVYDGNCATGRLVRQGGRLLPGDRERGDSPPRSDGLLVPGEGTDREAVSDSRALRDSLSGLGRGILPRSARTGRVGLDEDDERGAALRGALQLDDRQLSSAFMKTDDLRKPVSEIATPGFPSGWSRVRQALVVSPGLLSIAGRGAGAEPGCQAIR